MKTLLKLVAGALLGIVLANGFLFCLVIYSSKGSNPDDLPLNGLVTLHLIATLIGCLLGAAATRLKGRESAKQPDQSP